MSSNFPPGCSSPDGAIDHVFEAAIERMCDLARDAGDLNSLNNIMIRALHEDVRAEEIAWIFNAGLETWLKVNRRAK